MAPYSLSHFVRVLETVVGEVGLFLTGVGTALILLALIALIWSMVPR